MTMMAKLFAMTKLYEQREMEEYNFVISNRGYGRTEKIKLQAEKQGCIGITKKDGKWKYVDKDS